MSNLLSLYPEHPILAWRNELFETIPIDSEWWQSFFSYLREHATSPKTIGYTIARLFDLIGKNKASELIPIFPIELPFNNIDSILDGIYTYRKQLGHISNRNLALLPEFKLCHWNLISRYVKVPYDSAYKILLWAWSKQFWVPHAFDAEFKMPFRYMLGAMILKQNNDLELRTSIKQYWIGNNLVFPKNEKLFDHNINVQKESWFNLLCPEHFHISSMLLELAPSLTLYQLYEMLVLNEGTSSIEAVALPEIFIGT